MSNPRPIRYDRDTWIVMRDDRVLPKAVIRRYKDKRGRDQFLVIRWDLDPAERRLMAVCESLERADELVLWDNRPTHGYWQGPPNAHPAG